MVRSVSLRVVVSVHLVAANSMDTVTDQLAVDPPQKRVTANYSMRCTRRHSTECEMERAVLNVELLRFPAHHGSPHCDKRDQAKGYCSRQGKKLSLEGVAHSRTTR